MRIIIAATFLLLSILPAQAATHPDDSHFSGTELYKMCASKYDTDYGYCAGFVSAIANSLMTESVAGFRACNMGAVRSQQFVDIFKSYAEVFQTNLGSEANAVVAASLSRAFPCTSVQ